MKTNSKILIIFMMTAVLLFGCKKENNSTSAEKENTSNVNSGVSVEEDSNKTAPVVAEHLKSVDGAKIGSQSSYVVDREVWKDFVDEKHIDFAKRYEFGIHVPRILLDSEDAKAANDEIDGLVQSIKDLYEANKQNMEEFDTGVYSTFSVYQDENVLSVMIKSSNIWEGTLPQFTVFNFSLPDGKLIADDALMQTLGVEKDEILGMIENSLREEHAIDTSIYYRDITDSSYMYNLSNYTGLVFNDLWDHYNSKSRQIFLDEVGTPTFLFAGYASAEMGQSPAILKLRSNRFDSNPISEDYLRMARRLGIDPTDPNQKAFVIYLGSAFDETTLKDPLAKLYAWTAVFSNYEDPRMLIAMKQSEDDDRPYLIGEEYYLLIPKYKNASVSLKELEISEDGNLEEVDNPYLDSISCSGTTFICQNRSDIAPNGKITLRYRDDVLEFSPSISLKDGSLVLPEEVTDGEAILDWNRVIEEDAYSRILFERVRSIMGLG